MEQFILNTELTNQMIRTLTNIELLQILQNHFSKFMILGHYFIKNVLQISKINIFNYRKAPLLKIYT